MVHEQIRARVLAKVEAGETVDFVSRGIATPPGPTRLILEDRSNGIPGRTFRATLERDRDTFVLTVEPRLLHPIPTLILDAIRRAVLSVPGTEGCTEWRSAGGS
jgi:hypothetical protein